MAVRCINMIAHGVAQSSFLFSRQRFIICPVPALVESICHVNKLAEDTNTCMQLIYDGFQKLEFMYSKFVEDVVVGTAVSNQQVRCFISSNRVHPVLPQMFCNAMQLFVKMNLA